MTKLSEFYTDFFRVDLDAPGGYARVASVVARRESDALVHRAFKLLRHELEDKTVALQRFENELKLLAEITRDKFAPPAITRIYDSGFVEAKLSESLDKLQDPAEGLDPTPDLEIISTGVNIQKFLEMKSALMAKEPGRWLPYLVVDLAAYEDSLLLQIKKHSAGGFVELYALPVYTIVDMAQQLLGVMEYMHKKLHRAYIDWKPEHIYWNESRRRLKLIDWNVTTQLKGDARERLIVREDIRMFSGAALYCSLALTDPEDLKRPIGDDPAIPKDKEPTIRPRYWTSNPNFYQREKVLDEKIKQIVQTALDPNQGYNSPQELKDALTQYIKESDKQSDQDVVANLPGAVQHFRRARSYIAAEDYLYAAISLETAIESARAAGMAYRDAEKLLASVQDIVKAGELRQKVKLVLELGQWKDVVSLYNKAIAREPENVVLRTELDNLQALLRSESELRTRGIFRYSTNQFKLGSVLKSTRDMFNPDNHLYNYVKRQYNQIKLVQMSGVFMLFVVVLLASVSTGKLSFFQLFPTATALPSMPSPVPSMTPTQVMATLEPVATLTITPPTIMPTLIPTDTFVPTPSYTVKAYGILFTAYFYPLNKPDGDITTRVGPVLKYKQPLKIIGDQISHGSLWYECIWEIDGVTSQGWILADRIKVVPSLPTLIPTPTPTP